MTKRLQTMVMMLGYLTFTSVFFGALFTTLITHNKVVLLYGAFALIIGQILATIMINMIRKTDNV